MKAQIEQAINNIETMRQYFTSDDGLDNYYDIAGGLFTHNEPTIKAILPVILAKNDIIIPDIDNFIESVIYQNDLFTFVHTCSYWLEQDELFSIDIGEQEIQLDSTITSKLVANYIEKQTDSVINIPSDLAYIQEYTRIAVCLNISKTKEYLNE